MVPRYNGILHSNINQQELPDNYYHARARTTQKIRQEIQHSQELLNKLASKYSTNWKTVAKWKKRDYTHHTPWALNTGPLLPSPYSFIHYKWALKMWRMGESNPRPSRCHRDTLAN